MALNWLNLSQNFLRETSDDTWQHSFLKAQNVTEILSLSYEFKSSKKSPILTMTNIIIFLSNLQLNNNILIMRLCLKCIELFLFSTINI